MSFITLSEEPWFELIPGIRGKLIHAQNITMAHWEIDAGTVLPAHSHLHEQIAHVIGGSFELTIGGETRTLHAGMSGVIPSGVEHSGRALTDCQIIDVFHPVRDEYK